MTGTIADTSVFRRRHAIVTALTGKRLFFIGGSPKSGATWLQLLLDAHPQIACQGEGHAANHFGQLLLAALQRQNQYIETKNHEVFGELPHFPLYGADDLTYLLGVAILLPFSKYENDETIRVLGEKTPDNVRCFDLLHETFPDAKFLNVVRDGRDCAVSGWFHNLRVSPAWTRSQFPSFAAYAAAFAREWSKDVAHGQRFAALWPQSCLTVRYERMLADPAGVLGQMLAFLDVPADPTSIERCIAAASFERLSGGRQPGRENRHSFFRNGTAGNWRDHMDASVNDAFLAATAPWMQRLGYV